MYCHEVLHGGVAGPFSASGIESVDHRSRLVLGEKDLLDRVEDFRLGAGSVKPS